MPTYPIVTLLDGDELSPEWVADITDAANDADDRLAAVEATSVGLVAGYQRTTQKTAATGEHGILRIDDVAITTGRAYRIWTTPLHLDGSVVDILVARIRYTTDGTTPTTASPVLPGAEAWLRQADHTVAETKVIQVLYQPTVDETLSLILTIHGIVTGASTTMITDGTRQPGVFIEGIGASKVLAGTNL